MGTTDIDVFLSELRLRLDAVDGPLADQLDRSAAEPRNSVRLQRDQA
jgi:hypothetical protein